MQDHKIETLLVFSVFEKVRTHGKEQADGWVLEGLTARSDADGYNITLEDQHASVSVHFHNTISVNCEKERQLEEFISKLEAIDRQYDDRPTQ